MVIAWVSRMNTPRMFCLDKDLHVAAVAFDREVQVPHGGTSREYGAPSPHTHSSRDGACRTFVPPLLHTHRRQSARTDFP